MNWLKIIAIVGGVITIIFFMGSLTSLPSLLFASAPIMYFVVLKWVAVIVGLYLAWYEFFKRKGYSWALFSLVVAVLWNPIWEFHFGLSNWQTLDVVASVILLALVIVELRGGSVSDASPA